jgi:hypothetical protein
MAKGNWITFGIIILVVILAILVIRKPAPVTTEEVAKCIGKNSVLYVQLGCRACEAQEKMFGNYTSYLNKIDCFYEKDKCSDIKATPTWVIKGKKYVGVQSIETLKELTGC